MDFKEIIQKGLWEELKAYDNEATDEEKAALVGVMRAANALRAVLSRDQLQFFIDYVAAASEYLQASKKTAFERGVRSALNNTQNNK